MISGFSSEKRFFPFYLRKIQCNPDETQERAVSLSVIPAEWPHIASILWRGHICPRWSPGTHTVIGFAVTAPCLQFTKTFGVRRQEQLLCVRPWCSTVVTFSGEVQRGVGPGAWLQWLPTQAGLRGLGAQRQRDAGSSPSSLCLAHSPQSSMNQGSCSAFQNIPPVHLPWQMPCLACGKQGDEGLVFEVLLGTYLADSGFVAHISVDSQELWLLVLPQFLLLWRRVAFPWEASPQRPPSLPPCDFHLCQEAYFKWNQTTPPPPPASHQGSRFSEGATCLLQWFSQEGESGSVYEEDT